jgi:hypothetical protein
MKPQGAASGVRASTLTPDAVFLSGTVRRYLCSIIFYNAAKVMANKLTYKPTAILLSSQIGNIEIDSTYTYVDVAITGFGGVSILSERYYTYNNHITIYNIAQILEAHMRTSCYVYTDYTVSISTDGASTDSMTLHVLYCDRFTVCTSPETFYTENFLTTLATRRIASGTAIQLSLLAIAGESLDYSVAYHYRSNSGSTVHTDSFVVGSGATAATTSIITLNISEADILAHAASAKIELVSYTVTCGQRSASFFIDRSLDTTRQFIFRNCFNVVEIAQFRGVTTAKTDVDRTIAVVNGVSSFYNQQSTQTYEVEVNGLTADEAGWIDQLLTSYNVRTFVNNPCDDSDPLVLAAILITDMTCEMQDGDEKPNSLKFTWRYANDRPFIHLAASSGIFTSPYNPVFA